MVHARKIIYFFFFSLLITACSYNENGIVGDSKIVTQKMDFHDFDALEFSGVFNADLHYAEKDEVIISCNSNLAPYLEVAQFGEKIVFKLKDGYGYQNANIKATIYSKSINTIEASGASQINLHEFKTKNLSIFLSGATKVTAHLLETDDITIEGSGASKFRLDGSTKTLKVKLSGASKLKGKELNVRQNTIIDCSGASDVTIHTHADIVAKLSGASDLTYYGNGRIIDQQLSGASSIKRKQ
ncbi:hypothetical protein DNU06_14975 [Putridiphycobacter roseus]|uniref:Putative auto-transporter adhesin head GIN domain-containing protein n=1 Tax=Putridiphycobacter roseus TaxID=2219161 RepID=A0A2W1NND4_9FLAO|nr:DUF2807 domain-containing protein [Putridiphycobacter roseus]PZE16098.1 hypothetical protein DNU06_14975 [Putridiphycobacter roseus]